MSKLKNSSKEIPPTDGLQGWPIVFVGSLVLFVAFGIWYAFGTLFKPVQATFRATRGEISWIPSICGAFQLMCSGLNGFFIRHLGAKGSLFFGGCMSSLGVLFFSLSQNLWQAYLSFGVLNGFGLSFLFSPVLGTVSQWFDKKRGLANGIVVAGSGLGNLVFPLMVDAMLPGLGWRTTCACLALMDFVVLSAASIFLKPRIPPAQPPILVTKIHAFVFRTKKSHESEIENAKKEILFSENDRKYISVKLDADKNGDKILVEILEFLNQLPKKEDQKLGLALFKNRTFSFLYFSRFCISFGLTVPFVHIVPFCIDKGLTPAQGSAALAVMGAASVVGRVVLGWYADIFGRLRFYGFSLFVSGLSTCLWCLAFDFGGIIAFSVVWSLFCGAFISMLPSLVADFFGVEKLSAVLGVLFTANTVGSLVGNPIAGFIFDATQSYTISILFAGCMVLTGCFLTLPIKTPQNQPPTVFSKFLKKPFAKKTNHGLGVLHKTPSADVL